jgi:hypothetical protein
MADVIRLKMDCHEKFVLLMLANYCDAEGGSCFPSISRLAADTGISESSVKRALRNLKSYSGLIQVTPGGGVRSNRYQLATALIAQFAAANTPVTLTPVSVDPGQPDPPPGSHRPPTQVTVTHDPTKEPTIEPAIRERTIATFESQEIDPSHHDLAKQLGVDCLEEWAKYRDWMAASGKHHKDLKAGFRNWLRRAEQFKPKRDKHEAVSIAIWGDKAPARQRLKTIDEMFTEQVAVEGSYERLS